MKDWFESLTSYEACGLGGLIVAVGTILLDLLIHS